MKNSKTSLKNEKVAVNFFFISDILQLYCFRFRHRSKVVVTFELMGDFRHDIVHIVYHFL